MFCFQRDVTPFQTLYFITIYCLMQRKEMLVGILTKIPPPSNPEDALKITGALEAINTGPKTTLSSDAKVVRKGNKKLSHIKKTSAKSQCNG